VFIASALFIIAGILMVTGVSFIRDDVSLGLSLAAVGGTGLLSYLAGRGSIMVPSRSK